MSRKNPLTDYFSFGRKELIALLLIILVLGTTVGLPHFFRTNRSTLPVKTDTAWLSVVRQLETTVTNYKEYPDSLDNMIQQHNFQASSNSYFSPPTITPFYFDPNTLSAMDWKKLGLKDKTIQTIVNYRSKGGVFKKSEDLKKIYGLSALEYRRLLPYVQIEPDEIHMYSNKATKRPSKTGYQNLAIDINTADSTEWIALPGIGPVLTNRIINFRKKLGGFYSIEQVKETYGLSDSTFQLIKPMLQQGSTPVQQLNINTATLAELKAHPYISNNIAKLIVAYRNEHGNFPQIEEVQKIAIVTEETYNKMHRYLKTD